MRTWSNATREEVVAKYKLVGSVRETARLLKMGPVTVGRHLRAAGINPTRPLKYPVHKVIEAVVQSKTLNQASKRLGGYAPRLIEACLDRHKLVILDNLSIYSAQGEEITFLNYKSSPYWPLNDRSD